MKAISLKELLPQEAEIKLNKKTYHIRPVNADDWAWMEAKWGNPSQKLSGLSIHELCIILFRLLKEKKDFLPIEVDDYDDDGNSIKVTLTAPKRMAMALEGFEAISIATRAFERALGVADMSEEDIKAIKKGAQKKTHPRTKKRSAGQKSLMK